MKNNIEKEIKQFEEVKNNKILRREIWSSLDLGTFGKKVMFSTKNIYKRKIV